MKEGNAVLSLHAKESWTQQGAVKAMLASACTEMRANTLASAYMEMTAIEEKEGVKEEGSCLDPRA